MNIYRITNKGVEENFSKATIDSLKVLELIKFDRIESNGNVVVNWYRKAV